jgi:putative ABC transport system permease protein
MLRNYFKTAWRNMRSNKLFSMINIAGMAVSLAVCMLIINLLADQYSYDRFHKNADRIYRVMTTGSGGNDFKSATSAFQLSQELKSSFPGLEAAATVTRGVGGDLLFDQKAVTGAGYFADGNLFKVLDFTLSEGDAATALNKPFSMIISKALATQLFGNDNPMGKVVLFNDKQLLPGLPERGNREKEYGRFIITGVLNEVKGKTHLPFDLLASQATIPALMANAKLEPNMKEWDNVWYSYTYVLLSDNSSKQQLQQALGTIEDKYYPAGSPNRYHFVPKPLLKITPSNPIGNETHLSMPSVILIILAVLALIIMFSACFNYTNLTIARSLARAKEVGIRKINGATRKQVFLQFIIESVLVALFACLLAVGLLVFIREAFLGLWFNQFLKIDLQQTIWLYVIFLAFSLFNGVLAGLLPSLYLSAINPLSMIRNLGGRGFLKRLTLRKVLLVTQFTFSLIFIISTIVLYKQTNLTLHFDYGFHKDNVINVNLFKPENYQRFVQEVAKNKDVKVVAACSFLPSTGTNMGTQVFKAPALKDSLQTSYLDADYNFTGALDIQLIAGKNFPAVADTGSERFVVANETFIRKFNYESNEAAIGQRIKIDGNLVEITGVVKDFHFLDVTRGIEPLLLRNRPNTFSYVTIRTGGTNEAALIAWLEQTWKKVNPNTKFEYQFLDDQMKFTHSLLSDMAKILGTLAILAVIISCMGLMGMASYTAKAKAKEISIRKISGSNAQQIMFMLSNTYLKLITIATAIGLPLAILLNNFWLRFFVNRVSLGPLIMITGIFSLFLISLLIILSQSWKAAFANPIHALRQE